jgi:methylenetetrahydrofolate reductase (NADH)
MSSMNPDQLKASTELFADTVKGLKDLCQGVHIITIGGEGNLWRCLIAAKLG